MNISSLYYYLPSVAQNSLISLKSFLMRYRFMTDAEYQLKPIEEVKNAQGDYEAELIDRFNEYLQFACREVKFYREILLTKKLHWTQINIENYTDLLPLVSKQDIRGFEANFIPDSMINKRLFSIATSGTTGEPLRVYTDKLSRTRNYYCFNALLKNFGVNPKEASVTIGGKQLFKKPTKEKYWRYDYYSRTTYFSNYHLGSQTVDLYISKLEELDPIYIDSYPFPIVYIARHLNSLGRKYRGKRLKLILTSSEALNEEDSAELKAAFNCKVLNQYGNSEMTVFAYGESKEFYFPMLYGQVEFLRTDDNDYEIVSSGMINRGMVLLRYCTGDRITDVFSQSIFGSETSIVRGRNEDYLELAGGRLITQFNPVSNISTVKQAQIIQESFTSVRILVDTELSEKDRNKIIELTQDRLGSDVIVTVEKVSEFYLTNAGKFKFIIREF